MSDVYSGVTFESRCGPTTRVESKCAGTTTQEPNAASVANTDEKLKSREKRLLAGEQPAATTVLVTEFNHVSAAADCFAQLLPSKSMLFGDSCGIALPMKPQGEGKNELPRVSAWILMFLPEASHFCMPG